MNSRQTVIELLLLKAGVRLAYLLNANLTQISEMNSFQRTSRCYVSSVFMRV
jgi:hypothetical protein